MRAARSELAEHALGPGVLESPALGVHAREQVEIDVLEVNVVDERARASQEAERIAAAERAVAVSKHSPSRLVSIASSSSATSRGVST